MNIKVDVSNFIFNSKQFALMYIDFNSMRTVADVIHHICATFNLNETVGCKNFTLYDGVWYIPSNQSSYIFKEIKGIVRVFDDEEIKNLDLNSETVENSLHNNNNDNNERLFAYEQNSKSVYLGNTIPNSNVQNLSNVYLNNDENRNLLQKQEVTVNVLAFNNGQDAIGNISLEKAGNADDVHVKVPSKNISCKTTNAKKEIKYDNAETCMDMMDTEVNEEILNNFSRDTNVLTFNGGQDATDDISLEKTVDATNNVEESACVIAVNDVHIKVTSKNSCKTTKKKIKHDNAETCMNTMDTEVNGETLNNFPRDTKPLVNSSIMETEEYKSVNSFSWDDESVSSSIKKKRKRKHNKHKKNKTKEIMMSNDPPDEIKVVDASNDVGYKYMNKKNRASPKRTHKVFHSSEDEDDSESYVSFNKNVQFRDNSSNLSGGNGVTSQKQQIAKRRHTEEPMYENSKHQVIDQNENLSSFKKQNMDDCGSNFSYNVNTQLTDNSYNISRRNGNTSHKQKIPKRRYTDINSETMYVEESTNDTSKCKDIGQYTNISKDQNMVLESHADIKPILEPPVGRYEYSEPSSDVKHKFQKLLNLEFRPIPKIFTKTREIFRQDSNQEAIDSTWHSLPRSFASRKERTGHRTNEVISLNTEVTNISPVITTDNPRNDINMEDITVTEEQTSETNFIGVKPRKKNVRYMQSIGTTLSMLKSFNNSGSTSRRSTPNSQISDSKLPFTELNKDTQVKQTNGHSLNPQINISSDSNYNYNIDNNNKLIKESCTASNEIDRTVHCDDADSSILIESNECNGSFEQNLKKKMKSNENLICNRIVEDVSHVSKEIPQKSDLNGVNKGKGCDIDFESYPLLNTLPKPGDIIAAKVQSSDGNLSHCNSDYRPAKVINVIESILYLQFLDNEVIHNKEEIVNLEEEDGEKMDWRDLQSVRLLFP